MFAEDRYIAVIGAANIDIGGIPSRSLIAGDSNPGTISIQYGGVGRNIACNLCMLGMHVKLITAIGNDMLGSDMLRQCESLGMDMSWALRIPDSDSSMYLSVNDEQGDMAVAIDHTDICGRITPAYIDTVRDVLSRAAAVVMDANISADTFMHIKGICAAAGVPVYADPVSTSLAVRLRPMLDGIEAVKPNRLEAEYLSGMTIRTEADCIAAAEAILDMGVRRVFISMGSEGMLAADRNDMYIIGAYPAEAVCTAGAGDSATAAIVWASTVITDCSSLVTAAKAANAVAAMTISVPGNTDPELSPGAALDRMSDPVRIVRRLSKKKV